MSAAALRLILVAFLACGLVSPAAAQQSNSKHLAPGFAALPKGAKVALMPTDIELFLISAGGVFEPKADWTEAAQRHFRTALLAKKKALGLATVEISEADADELAEMNNLHGAVAQAIAVHHFGPLPLPTKDGKLDWSLGEVVSVIKAKTGAEYALFSWVRDSYASEERKAMMIGMALLGIGIGGGAQIGYASLVDLNSGRVVWFNRLMRATGDLREPEKAAETLNALLEQFPVTR